jgi:Leucine-rich repeat (LRR) protein
MIPQGHKLDWNSNRIPNLIDNATSSSYNNLVGSANTSTIVTTKVGTFSSTWKGSGILYFDPVDGGPIEPLVLTADGVAWNHEYLSVGSKTIKIIGDLSGVTYLYAISNGIVNDLGSIVSGLTNLVNLYLRLNSISGDISAVSGLTSLVNLDLHSNSISGDISAVSGLTSLVNLYLHYNSISGDISAVSGLTSLVNLYLYYNSLSFTYTQFPPWDGSTYDLRFCVSTSEEVGDLILAAANGGMNNCIYKLDGTNPAPPSTQEITDGIATLVGNGVTLYVST